MPKVTEPESDGVRIFHEICLPLRPGSFQFPAGPSTVFWGAIPCSQGGGGLEFPAKCFLIILQSEDLHFAE